LELNEAFILVTGGGGDHKYHKDNTETVVRKLVWISTERKLNSCEPCIVTTLWNKTTTERSKECRGSMKCKAVQMFRNDGNKPKRLPTRN
jgi:hypothetical protein